MSTLVNSHANCNLLKRILRLWEFTNGTFEDSTDLSNLLLVWADAHGHLINYSLGLNNLTDGALKFSFDKVNFLSVLGREAIDLLDLVLCIKDLANSTMKFSTEEIDLLLLLSHFCCKTLHICLCINYLIYCRIKFTLYKILFFSFIRDTACKGCDCILSLSNLSEGALKLASNLTNLLSILLDGYCNFVDNVFGLSNLDYSILEPVFDKHMSSIVNAHSDCHLLERILCLRKLIDGNFESTTDLVNLLPVACQVLRDVWDGSLWSCKFFSGAVNLVSNGANLSSCLANTAVQGIKFLLLSAYNSIETYNFALNCFHVAHQFTKVCVWFSDRVLKSTDFTQFSIDFSFDKDELLVMEYDILLILFDRRLSWF